MMPQTAAYTFARYLQAKKSVDDRALNRLVWQTLAKSLPQQTPGSPLRVLEVGAGIGTMLERMLSWKLLKKASYTGIDVHAGLIRTAQERLPAWAAGLGYRISRTPTGLRLADSEREVTVTLQAADVFDVAASPANRAVFDVLVAHAFLDLVDLPSSLPALFNLLRAGGLFYFTINFDGLTVLEPEIDPELDALVLSLYHRTMDERLEQGRPSGDSRTGRHLFSHLEKAGAMILDAGASDWVVFARTGAYPEDEAYFLHHLLHTIQEALADCPELDYSRLKGWIDLRHAQVERGELVCLAHQLDFVGQVLQWSGRSVP